MKIAVEDSLAEQVIEGNHQLSQEPGKVGGRKDFCLRPRASRAYFARVNANASRDLRNYMGISTDE